MDDGKARPRRDDPIRPTLHGDRITRVTLFADPGEEPLSRHPGPASPGWTPPLPYPYVASFPILGPDGGEEGTLELAFRSPTAFEERLVSGGADEANFTILVEWVGAGEPRLGEPTFRPATEGGK